MPIVGDLLTGRYRIVAPLGAGGMATVWRARDERLDRDVAIKVLLANLAADPLLAARFDREARALAAASHPAIVAIYDVEPGDPATGREPFYVMELCEGGSLADRLAGGSLPPDDAIHIVAAVAEGLAALHERGILHRDVKPANILVCGGRPKLADFGLARSEHLADESALTAAGTVAGTLAYLAPELITGHQATAASDAYALGVVAFQALGGSLPKAPASMAELVEARHAIPPMVSAAAPELGDAFDGAVAAALAPDPDARPDALGLAADLVAALGRWHRSGIPARRTRSAGRRTGAAVRPTAAAGSPAASQVEPATGSQPVDSALNTVVIPSPGERLADRAATRPGRRGLVALAAVVGTIAGLAVLSAVLGGDGRPGSSAASIPPGSPAVSAGPATPTATPTPTPTPTSTPTPTPTAEPTVTPNPAAPALEALDDVRAAIEQARRTGGLKRPDANELLRLADDVGKALAALDFDLARERTDRLAARIEDFDKVDKKERDAMRDAVAALRDAIP